MPYSRARLLRALVLTLACVLISGPLAKAASINYGNFGPISPGLTFQNVTESSGTDAVPLYGPPTPFAIGLDFDPKGFVATSSGGTSDITDGQLNYNVVSSPNVGINTLTVNEGGDYTLAGTGTAATQVLAGVIFNVKVSEVDGVAITPVSFSSNASVAFNLIANAGIVQPWSMSTSVPIAAELTALNIPFTVGATKIEVTMNNQLLSFSEAGSLAFIAKKDFVVTAVPNVVPEPASLGAIGMAGMLMLARRRKSA